MKKLLLVVLATTLLLNLSVVSHGTFYNEQNGYKGLWVVLDEPVRKLFEKVKLHEIEFPGKVLISFNTFDY